MSDGSAAWAWTCTLTEACAQIELHYSMGSHINQMVDFDG